MWVLWHSVPPHCLPVPDPPPSLFSTGNAAWATWRDVRRILGPTPPRAQSKPHPHPLRLKECHLGTRKQQSQDLILCLSFSVAQLMVLLPYPPLPRIVCCGVATFFLRFPCCCLFEPLQLQNDSRIMPAKNNPYCVQKQTNL